MKELSDELIIHQPSARLDVPWWSDPYEIPQFSQLLEEAAVYPHFYIVVHMRLVSPFGGRIKEGGLGQHNA